MKRVFLVCACLVLSVPCMGVTITVDDDGSADYTTIQAAIDASNNGDIIVVRPSTYTGEGNYNITFGGKAITVRSTNPQDPNVVAATIVDCEYLGRGFHFQNSEGIDSVINGLTIVNADDSSTSEDGGAIRCDHSSPMVANCRILNSLGYLGGAICNENSSSPTLINCIISGNVGIDSGGGISNSDGSDPNMVNCTFSGNSSWMGGAIYNDKSSPTLNNCAFSGNDADFGGGIFNLELSSPKLINCTFSANLATVQGAALFNNGHSNATFSNCILWGNVPDEVYVNTGTVTVDYSDVQGGYPGAGNIDADPYFADPNNDDYRLKSEAGRWDPNSKSWVLDDVTSPCIDAGNPGCPLGNEPNDLSNVRINMGAYGRTGEASRTPVGWGLLADLTNDWTVDYEDFAGQSEDWQESANCQPGDMNRDGMVNLPDAVLMAADWLGCRSAPLGQ